MTALDLNRTGGFLRYELLSRRQDLLLPLIVPPAFFALITLFSFAIGRPITEWPQGTFTVALILGAGAAAYAHRRELQPGTASIDMMLPVSHGERFVARLISSLALPFFGQLVLLTLIANLAAAIGILFGHAWTGPLIPEGRMIAGAFTAFLAWHSALFTGGAFFRGSPIIKTGLASLGYGAVMLIVFSSIVFSQIRDLISIGSNVQIESTFVGSDTFRFYLIFAWGVVFPALLYVAAFFRTTENEDRG